ncbi:MAG: zinc-ribbon domain containing protein [Polyangiaceae bacterium]|nr:zinc-ribbon domain containing protein [Polyangiaceae bacterium]
MEQRQDEHFTCADCGTSFVFTAAEAAHFADKGLEPPKRCFECRKARRAQKAQGGGGRGPRHSHGDRAPRSGGQFGGDVNGYRSPMSDPAWSRDNRDGEYRSPGFRDGGGGGGGYRDNRGPVGGDYRNPGYSGERRPYSNEYRAPAYSAGRPGEYRSPSFTDQRGGRGEYRAPGFGGDRGGYGGGDRRPGGYDQRPGGYGGGGGYDRGPRPDYDRGGYGGGGGYDRGPRRHQGDKPSYPITCAQCGVAAEVPFKPIEGREILCRDCYRAKKDSGM